MWNIILIVHFVLIALICNDVSSYRILGIVPTPSKSHYFVGSALMKGLAADGHEVTVAAAYKEKNTIPNYTEIYIDDVVQRFKSGSSQNLRK